MGYVKKKMASWEIKYGQIGLSGKEFRIARNIFADYFGKTFELVTFNGTFPNRHLIYDDDRGYIRFACTPFFSKLREGEVIYLKPIDESNIGVYRDEPEQEAQKVDIKEMKQDISKAASPEVTTLLVDLVKENRKLREENQELIMYKDRLEKYQNLGYIFEDERFMEDWLERNIHKAVANLEVIDRQPVVMWNEPFMRNRPDFFCLDKTTKELVIVENKVRGRHKKVETQFLTYKAWVNRNLLEINEKYKDRNLRATKDFKFVIITDTTDERLEAVCEDSKIALVVIDGGVVFEEIVPYYCE
jgi:hypothetical protein